MAPRASRQAQQRTYNSRKETYKPFNPFALPDDFVKEFASQGMEIKFVRHLLDGKEDTKNLREKFYQGWVPVTRKEVPDHFKNDFSLFETYDLGNFKDVISAGDLILCKIPVEKNIAVREFFENKAVEQVRALPGTFKGNNSKMNRLAPVEDVSKTTTISRQGKSTLNFGSEDNSGDQDNEE